jgi:sortase A
VTALDSPTEAVEAAPRQTDVPPTRVPASARKESQRVFTVAVVALAILVVVWIVFQLFEGPVADAWYRTRQHQLASRVVAARPKTHAGKGIAILQVPKLGTNVVVVQGDAPQQLRTGPGHRAGTPMPGDVGNSVIAGHRHDWGGPFSSFNEIGTGDLFVVQIITPDGIEQNGVFTVQSVRKVSGSDTSPFMPSDDRRVTLVTGAGDRFSDKRLVVTGVSGPAGHTLAATRPIHTSTSGGSLWWNGNMLLALVCCAAAVLTVRLLRRRYHTATITAIVVPMLALATLLVLLDLDTALPVVR